MTKFSTRFGTVTDLGRRMITRKRTWGYEGELRVKETWVFLFFFCFLGFYFSNGRRDCARAETKLNGPLRQQTQLSFWDEEWYITRDCKGACEGWNVNTISVWFPTPATVRNRIQDRKVNPKMLKNFGTVGHRCRESAAQRVVCHGLPCLPYGQGLMC